MTVFQEDFLQTIVNVNWGGGNFATLEFKADEIALVSTLHFPTVTIPQLGISFPLMTIAKSGTIYRVPDFYRKESQSRLPPITTYTKNYNTEVHTVFPTGVSFGTASVNTLNGVSSWSAGAASGMGDIDAYIAWELSQTNVVSATAVLTSSSSHTVLGAQYFSDEDISTAIFDLDAIKKAIAGADAFVDFTFSTGAQTTPPESLSPGSYTWTSTFKTYKGVKWTSFPMSSKGVPGLWPKPFSIDIRQNPSANPTPSVDIIYEVNLAAM